MTDIVLWPSRESVQDGGGERKQSSDFRGKGELTNSNRIIVDGSRIILKKKSWIILSDVRFALCWIFHTQVKVARCSYQMSSLAITSCERLIRPGVGRSSPAAADALNGRAHAVGSPVGTVGPFAARSVHSIRSGVEESDERTVVTFPKCVTSDNRPWHFLYCTTIWSCCHVRKQCYKKMVGKNHGWWLPKENGPNLRLTMFQPVPTDACSPSGGSSGAPQTLRLGSFTRITYAVNWKW